MSGHTAPNGSYSATYGDEFELFGRPLGLIESWNLSRTYDEQNVIAALLPEPQ